MDFERHYVRCHAQITIQDYLDGLDSGLCGHCSNLLDKAMREERRGDRHKIPKGVTRFQSELVPGRHRTIPCRI
jgi:hypothetical protein